MDHADRFDQVDAELVRDLAELQELVAGYAATLNLAGMAASGLSNLADRRGDVYRVAGLERAAERLRQASGYVSSAAAVLRMIEEPDEKPQELPDRAPRLEYTAATIELDRNPLRPCAVSYPVVDVLDSADYPGRVIHPLPDGPR